MREIIHYTLEYSLAFLLKHLSKISKFLAKLLVDFLSNPEQFVRETVQKHRKNDRSGIWTFANETSVAWFIMRHVKSN